MRRLTYQVTFHSPLRIGTGRAAPGLQQTAWSVGAGGKQLVAPGSSVKGVMRAALAGIADDGLIEKVFGQHGQACAWSFGALSIPDGAMSSRRRTRIAVDSRTGTTEENMLVVAEELVVAEDVVGEFVVRAVPGRRLSDVERETQIAVLHVAAGLVKGIGSNRRRGLGWVSITPKTGDPHRTFEAAARTVLGGVA